MLKKSSPATAVRQARLIRFRLESVDTSNWPLIKDGEKEVATQLLFAAALKHSELLTDFVREVVATRAVDCARIAHTGQVRTAALRASPREGRAPSRSAAAKCRTSRCMA